jgi:hypothetical protein
VKLGRSGIGQDAEAETDVPQLGHIAAVSGIALPQFMQVITKVIPFFISILQDSR